MSPELDGAKAATAGEEVSTDARPTTAGLTGVCEEAPSEAKASTTNEVSTDSAAVPAGNERPGHSPTASACEPYRDLIGCAVRQGRNAMATICQDLVDDHGFPARYASVKRFVGKLRGVTTPEARMVIETASGEDYGEPRVMLRRTSTAALR